MRTTTSQSTLTWCFCNLLSHSKVQTCCLTYVSKSLQGNLRKSVTHVWERRKKMWIFRTQNTKVSQHTKDFTKSCYIRTGYVTVWWHFTIYFYCIWNFYEESADHLMTKPQNFMSAHKQFGWINETVGHAAGFTLDFVDIMFFVHLQKYIFIFVNRFCAGASQIVSETQSRNLCYKCKVPNKKKKSTRTITVGWF